MPLLKQLFTKQLLIQILRITSALYIFVNNIFLVSARSKALVYGCSPAEMAGSNPAGGMDVCLL